MTKKSLAGESYKRFFDDAVKAARGTKGASRTMWEVMEKHGVKPDYLPPELEEELMPLLNSDLSTLDSSSCGACGTCAACILCEEVNFAAGAIAVTCITSLS